MSIPTTLTPEQAEELTELLLHARNQLRDQMRGKPRPSQLAAQQLGGEAA